jgi:hypothetical protein
MTKQLTVHNATINTAAVEVKTLTISGKQVTLAVFRQLREEQLIAQDGTFNGTPWGWVNYHPDKCDGDKIEHLHVVWQRGTDLLRSRVNVKPVFPKTVQWPEANRLLTARVARWIAGVDSECPIRREDQRHLVDQLVWQEEAGVAVLAEVSYNAKNAAWWAQRKTELHEGTQAWTEGQVHATTAIKNLQAELGDVPYAEMLREYHQKVQVEVQRRRAHRARRKELAELPQLFIAV